MQALVNGRPASVVQVGDRGLAFGDGLFETMRLAGGRLPLLEAHLQRLQRGCARLRMPFPALALRRDLEQIVRWAPPGQDALVKLILTRGAGGQGYAPGVARAPTRLLMLSELPARPARWWRDGVMLWPCRTRLGLNPDLAGLKHLNRLENVLARAEWSDPRYAEGILRDVDGFYIEATASNLFLVVDGRLLTPELDRCGVAGVMRQLLLSDWAGLAGELEPRQCAVDEALLARAEEVFLTNALIGAWPVIACGPHRWPVGPVCRAVQQRVERLFNA